MLRLIIFTFFDESILKIVWCLAILRFGLSYIVFKSHLTCLTYVLLFIVFFLRIFWFFFAFLPVNMWLCKLLDVLLRSNVVLSCTFVGYVQEQGNQRIGI